MNRKGIKRYIKRVGYFDCQNCIICLLGDPAHDHAGPPLPCNNIKLEDIPDMDYWTSKNQGEICVRGSNVFLGYYRDPDMTSAVLDNEGWLHTGDVGEWMENGTLRYKDR